MNKFSRDLIRGMKEAADFVEGEKAGARVHVVEIPDVRSIASSSACRSSASPRRTGSRCPRGRTGSRGAEHRMRRRWPTCRQALANLEPSKKLCSTDEGGGIWICLVGIGCGGTLRALSGGGRY